MLYWQYVQKMIIKTIGSSHCKKFYRTSLQHFSRLISQTPIVCGTRTQGPFKFLLLFLTPKNFKSAWFLEGFHLQIGPNLWKYALFGCTHACPEFLKYALLLVNIFEKHTLQTYLFKIGYGITKNDFFHSLFFNLMSRSCISKI